MKYEMTVNSIALHTPIGLLSIGDRISIKLDAEEREGWILQFGAHTISGYHHCYGFYLAKENGFQTDLRYLVMAEQWDTRKE